MKTIRNNTFETNSSSTHTLVLDKKEYKDDNKEVSLNLTERKYFYNEEFTSPEDKLAYLLGCIAYDADLEFSEVYSQSVYEENESVKTKIDELNEILKKNNITYTIAEPTYNYDKEDLDEVEFELDEDRHVYVTTDTEIQGHEDIFNYAISNIRKYLLDGSKLIIGTDHYINSQWRER